MLWSLLSLARRLTGCITRDCPETSCSRVQPQNLKMGCIVSVRSFSGGKDGLCSVDILLPLESRRPTALYSLLFSLFLFDIARDLEPGIRHIVYADDLHMYVPGRIRDVHNFCLS